METAINRKPFKTRSLITSAVGRLVSTLCILSIGMIRPLLGPASCKFQESCTPYAVRQLKENSFLRALINIAKRLIACSPFSCFMK